jgi:cytochrome c553
MTPRPPLLPPVIAQWSDEELFWVVKHGIKYTGMPAWPTQARDDEVWAVVAFLNVLPGLDREGYLQLALGEMSEEPAGPPGDQRLAALGGTPAAGVEECARCHGMNGLGRESGAFPRLAGQSEEYLTRSLESFAAGRRPSGIMEPIADGLDEAQRRQIAAYYAALPPGQPQTSNPGGALFDLGRRLAAEGVPSENVPICSSCHDAPRANPLYPSLAGQPQIYLKEQLRLFRDGVRGATSHAEIMTRAAQGLSEDHIAALAAYYSALDPGSRSSP